MMNEQEEKLNDEFVQQAQAHHLEVDHETDTNSADAVNEKTTDSPSVLKPRRNKMKRARTANIKEAPSHADINMDGLQIEDVIIKELDNFPAEGDENLSLPWRNYIKKLSDAVLHLQKVLKCEQVKNQKKSEEVDVLKNTVSSLAKNMEQLTQWQSLVYAEIQKVNAHNEQYSERFSEMYSFFSKQSQVKVESGTKNKESVQKSTAQSKPVIYGDSAVAKKLDQRKIFGVKSDQQSSQLNNETEPPNSESMSSSEMLETEIDHSDGKEKEGSELEKSIEETLREAAESVAQTSGFVYDECSGLYYDWNSKMYYDPSNQLYYDHDNGIYYTFDVERKSYLFHSQIDIPKETSAYQNTKENTTDAELSEGELCSDEEDTMGDSVVVDPCIRMTVVQSESLDVGSLFIITCKGGSVGREKSNIVCIPEEIVSKTHATILYDDDEKTFFLRDDKTQNGTFINNERLADSKAESEAVELAHRDYVKIGGTVLSVHIHLGHDTCSECEPGNIQALIAAKEHENRVFEAKDLNSLRKKEMKSLRKKYGINPGYIPKGLIESIPDRAASRRKNVGSDPYEKKDAPVAKASVHKQIPQENKGHKMLAKMGWKTGEGLGKTSSGITQPITVDVLQKKKGLGTGTKVSLDQVADDNRKAERWNKAKERYDKLDQI